MGAKVGGFGTVFGKFPLSETDVGLQSELSCNLGFTAAQYNPD
jgi:hypothetical protein